MKKKEEEQSAKLIRCGMGLVLGGVAALAVPLKTDISVGRDWRECK